MNEQPAASKSEEERFLEAIGELKSPNAWLLFINYGFSMTTAKSLHDKGLIEASLQMGMAAARLKRPDAAQEVDDPIVFYPADVICARCGALAKLRIEVRGHANIVATCEGCGK